LTLIVHAPNVHQGGGRALLIPLLEAAASSRCIVIADARLGLPSILPHDLAVVRVAPTLIGRLLGEWRLKKLAKAEDVVLCFGNLPPLFHISGNVRVFLQNRYLFGRRDFAAFGWRARLRLLIERYWMYFRLKNTIQVYVQTSAMARELEVETGIKARVLSFLPVATQLESRRDLKRFDFIYVATGEPHKNHRNLVEAWKLLAKDGLHPSLCLTLDHEKDRHLLSWVEFEIRTACLRIENVGLRSREDLDQHYRESGALIYPSTLESFGLPLLEGAAVGLPILASELDYVRDVSVPVQTFDPGSPVSIARAVKRHWGMAESPPQPLSPAAFLQAIQDPGQ
jgi:glycosyltransferase involved in cell wall biosynthesis